MPDLLHECWEDDEGVEFGPVHRRLYELRSPRARKLFDLRASSWTEAMQGRNRRLDYGEYFLPEGIEDRFYTDAERAEQDAYLSDRKVR